MDKETIVIVGLAFVVTLITFLIGMDRGIPKRIKDEFGDLLPTWLQIIFFIPVFILEVAVGFLLREIYWLVCGVWLVSGFLLGLLIQRTAWRMMAQEEWIEKKRREKEARASRPLSMHQNERRFKLSESAQSVLGVILVVIILCVLLAIPSTREWMTKTFFPEKPWLALYYPDTQSHLAKDKTFNSLEECRAWAYDQAGGKPLGEWDYSCGYKCEYTRDMLRQQGQGFEFDCDTVTK